MLLVKLLEYESLAFQSLILKEAQEMIANALSLQDAREDVADKEPASDHDDPATSETPDASADEKKEEPLPAVLVKKSTSTILEDTFQAVQKLLNDLSSLQAMQQDIHTSPELVGTLKDMQRIISTAQIHSSSIREGALRIAAQRRILASTTSSATTTAHREVQGGAGESEEGETDSLWRRGKHRRIISNARREREEKNRKARKEADQYVREVFGPTDSSEEPRVNTAPAKRQRIDHGAEDQV